MAKKKRHYRLKNRRTRHHSLMARKHNPSRRRYRVKNRRNPFGFSTPVFLETAGWAIVGGMLTRIIPQAATPNMNTGPVGYIENGVVAGVLAWLAGMYKREAGLGVALGGTMMIAARIVSDYFGKTLVTFGTVQTDGSSATVTPVATTNAPATATQSLSQGDLAFDLRDYRGTYFPLPSSTINKNLTSKTPWSGDIQKLQALLTAGGKGAPAGGSSHGQAPKSSNMPGKPTSLKGGRYAGVM